MKDKEKLLDSNVPLRFMKIKYGEKHFKEFEDIEFKKVENVGELLI